jgi:hypothetical protein
VGALVRRLAVAVIALGLLQPRAFVWCRTEAGHAALEPVEDGCCGTPAPEARCSRDLSEAAPPGPAGDGADVESDACRDVLVETPADRPHDERLSRPLVAVALPSPDVEPTPPATAPSAAGRGETARAAAHDLVLSTVLRN